MPLNELIQRVQELDEKAQAGPWTTAFRVMGGYDCMSDSVDVIGADGMSIVNVDLGRKPTEKRVEQANSIVSLIAEYRTLAPQLAAALEASQRETQRLQHQEWRLLNGSACEIGATNHSVADYMKHWEERALKAERETQEARDIARLVGRIYFYGGFKAETVNERELERRLRKAGCFYENEQQVLDDPISSWPRETDTGESK